MHKQLTLPKPCFWLDPEITTQLEPIGFYFTPDGKRVNVYPARPAHGYVPQPDKRLPKTKTLEME